MSRRRPHFVGCRLTDSERQLVDTALERHGRTMDSLVRGLVLDAAREMLVDDREDFGSGDPTPAGG